MRPDKAKVIDGVWDGVWDEVWDDARIASFLDKGAMASGNQQYSQLSHAFRSLRATDFARLIDVFFAAGGGPAAQSISGQRLTDTIAGHVKSAPFLEILTRSKA
ncbi:MAG: PA4642 family protein [Pseudomonadota bacterium]